MARLLLKKPRGVIRTGLVAEYRFDEGSGTTLTDRSGRGNHGTLGAAAAAPSWTTTGASFDGGDYIDCGNRTDFQFSQYTICVVWNPAGADADGTLVAKNTSNATGPGRTGFFFMQTSAGAGGVRILQFDSDGAGTLHYVTSASAPTAGSWQFSAAACNLTKVYISQSAASTWSAGGTTMTAAAPNIVQSLTIGKYAYGSDVYYTGSIAYILIYNRMLSQSELTYTYKYLKSYLLTKRGISVV